MRKTKIVCTIGPASEAEGILRALIAGGMDVARLNFSHGTREGHLRRIRLIRRIAEEEGKRVAILQDLAGPKIRIGELPTGGIFLKPGDTFILTTREKEGSPGIVSVSYPGLVRDVSPGDRILLADGAVELEVVESGGEKIRTRVVIGGPLSSHKGINVPCGTLDLPSLTGKDREDLFFGLDNGVDFVAMSFVRRAEDIDLAREVIHKAGKETPVIAKIEKHEAVTNLDAIIDRADGVMVARGDLGVEIPLEQVPRIQKEIIHRANQAGKPVITATQMLRSMVDAPRPTRAEAADVANAILDGTDALMLSEETASGQYPEQAFLYMARIAVETEKKYPHERYMANGVDGKNTTQAVAHAACSLSEHIDAPAIVAFTQSGTTARALSRFRPARPILALSPNEEILSRLSLHWNVIPCCVPPLRETDEMVEKAAEMAVEMGVCKPGDAIVMTAGLPVLSRGTTNMIRVKEIGAGGLVF